MYSQNKVAWWTPDGSTSWCIIYKNFLVLYCLDVTENVILGSTQVRVTSAELNVLNEYNH